MKKLGALVAIRSARMGLVTGSVWLFASLGIGSAEAIPSSPLPNGQGLQTQSVQTLMCQLRSCSSSVRLVDTRDHDDENVVGERIKKDTSAQKHKAGKSMKPQQGAKRPAGQPRGTEDRRDLKEDQSTTGDAQDKRPDDRRQGGESPTNP